MGVLKILEGDVIQKKYSKKVIRKFPPYDTSADIIYHCKSIDMVKGTVVVDRYLALDSEGKSLEQQQQFGEKNITISLNSISDDTTFEDVKEQIFGLYVSLDRVKKEWTLSTKLYPSLAAAQAGLGTMDVAIFKITNDGNFYIADARLVPLAK